MGKDGLFGSDQRGIIMAFDINFDELDFGNPADGCVERGQPDLGRARRSRRHDSRGPYIGGVDQEVRPAGRIAQANQMAGDIAHELRIEREDFEGALIGLEGMHVLEVI